MTGARTSARPAAAFDGGRHLLSVGLRDGGAVLAMPGDVMTCPDGHPVLRVVAPVLAASRTDPAWFARLDCDEPPPVGPLPPCPTCGCEVCPPIFDDKTLRHTGRYGLFINGELARAREVAR